MMKFIESHEKTHSLLQQWSHFFRLVIASFYHCYKGDPMQKSFGGFLQSVIHRILEVSPDLIEVICPERMIAVHEPSQIL